MKDLNYFYAHKDYFMITAHRGASFEFPENTFPAMEKAVEAGADMIEFDLRGTKENIPVLLHDQTIDRTSNGKGAPEEYTLAELKKFNFSYFLQETRRTAPIFPYVAIPTFEEILEAFSSKICMNIQVYAKNDATLQNICKLYKKYDMYGKGYFTITPDVVDKVRSIDPEIELCVTRGWETRSDPENLRLCKEDKCRFVQPIKDHTTKEAYDLIRELGMRSNTFYTDDPADIKVLQEMGSNGILTNKAHLMCMNRPN
jgi:glycerophosphoryl diester phosphodiesterase